MVKRLRRVPLVTVNENRGADDQPEFRSVKKEKLNRLNDNSEPECEPESEPEHEPGPVTKRPRSARTGTGRNASVDEEAPVQGPAERRVLRSQYQAVKNMINEEREELSKGDSDRLLCLIQEVDDLYEHVQRPREQVADAEALLDIANAFVATVRSHSKDGFTPSDFISSLLQQFGTPNRRSEDQRVSIKWKDVGMLVSPVFRRAHGCSTMVGPMNTEFKVKQRRVSQRRRGRTTERAARPEQLENTGVEEKTDTDKNMATMFGILRNKKSARLENLILNRHSFAQTVENLFALSFLVKDGRAQVAADDKGIHLVSLRNAPPSELVQSRQVLYHHFVFRFDFKDWKLMLDTVVEGEELMPHRYQMCVPLSQEDELPGISPVAIPTSPIRVLSRNRGRPLNDECVTQVQ